MLCYVEELHKVSMHLSCTSQFLFSLFNAEMIYQAQLSVNTSHEMYLITQYISQLRI